MAHGTAITKFKTAFIALLDAQTTEKVAYQSPRTTEDIIGPSGSGVAAWFSDDASATYDVNVFTAGAEWWDESSRPVLRIQAIGNNTDDDQEDVDGRASEILRLALAVVANDPACGVADSTLENLQAIPAALTYSGGLIGSDQRAARFELTFDLTARLKFTL